MQPVTNTFLHGFLFSYCTSLLLNTWQKAHFLFVAKLQTFRKWDCKAWGSQKLGTPKCNCWKPLVCHYLTKNRANSPSRIFQIHIGHISVAWMKVLDWSHCGPTFFGSLGHPRVGHPFWGSIEIPPPRSQAVQSPKNRNPWSVYVPIYIYACIYE